MEGNTVKSFYTHKDRSHTSHQQKETAKHVAEESQQQAAIVEESAAALEEISGSTSASSANTYEAKEIILESEKAIGNGNQSSRRALKAMEDIGS